MNGVGGNMGDTRALVCPVRVLPLLRAERAEAGRRAASSGQRERQHGSATYRTSDAVGIGASHREHNEVGRASPPRKMPRTTPRCRTYAGGELATRTAQSDAHGLVATGGHIRQTMATTPDREVMRYVTGQGTHAAESDGLRPTPLLQTGPGGAWNLDAVCNFSQIAAQTTKPAAPAGAGMKA